MRYLDATGNRFVLVDGIADDTPDDPARLARELCGPGDELHGLLLLTGPSPAAAQADVRMQVWNADGSRPEACGNGLRCIARAAFEAGHVPGPAFRVETDSGVRRVSVEARGGGTPLVTAEVGVARVGEAFSHELDGATFEVHPVDVGNPHAVVFVENVLAAPLERWGHELACHSAFPDGVNVELAQPLPERLLVRVWERGVGETGSCGTGAAAVATAARAAASMGRNVVASALQFPGGILFAEVDDAGRVALTDAVTEFTW